MKRSESYIKSPEWLINKRATVYPKTENDVIVFSMLKLLH